MPVKRCYVVTTSNDPNAWTRVAKWKVIIIGRDGPHGSCGRKVLHRQIFRRQLSAICGQKAHTHSTAFSWVRDASSGRRLSVCVITTSRKNGTVKPSEALKEMAAKYRPRRGMCWVSGYSILSLKIANSCKLGKSKSFPDAPRILIIKLRFER